MAFLDKVHKLSQAGDLVFFYETLRNIATVHHVLGETPPHWHAAALDVKKVPRKIGGETYYTLEWEPRHKTFGIIVQVTAPELAKIDAWEEKYERLQVLLDDGRRAWAYGLKNTGKV